MRWRQSSAPGRHISEDAAAIIGHYLESAHAAHLASAHLPEFSETLDVAGGRSLAGAESESGSSVDRDPATLSHRLGFPSRVLESAVYAKLVLGRMAR